MRKKVVLLLLVVLLFLFGLGMLSYPFLASYFYQKGALEIHEEYVEAVAEYSDEELAELRAQAEEYNRELRDSGVSLMEPFDPKKYNIDEMYEKLPTQKPEMGYISIPSLHLTLPIYHTTESTVLEMGAGHMVHTSLPVGGPGTHAVISAHSGLPNAEMFTNLDRLTIGSLFTIEILGETLTYRVYGIEVVEPDDVASLSIQEDRDLVTLVTCTPLGINTHRLLVHGERVPEEALSDAVAQEPEPTYTLGYRDVILILGAGITVVFLLLLGFLLIRTIRRRSKKSREEP